MDGECPSFSLFLSLSRALPLALLHSLVASISIVYPREVILHTPFFLSLFLLFLCSFFVLAYATDSRCVRLIKWSTIRSTVLTSNVCCLSCVRTHALLSSFFFFHTPPPLAYKYPRAHLPPPPLSNSLASVIPLAPPFHSLVVLL